MNAHKDLNLAAETALENFELELKNVNACLSQTQRRAKQLATLSKLIVPVGAGYTVLKKIVFKKKPFKHKFSPLAKEALIFILSNLVLKFLRK